MIQVPEETLAQIHDEHAILFKARIISSSSWREHALFGEKKRHKATETSVGATELGALL